MEKKWWNNSVVYQVYPRSFQDSNDDGIGDLRGIIQRLDYLADLGIDVIWLSPIYQSPNDDNGYDISDYEAISSEFGTMADVEELIKQSGERGIKILMDLVVNHTSDEHIWFKEASKSRENPYRDYYIWRDPLENGEVPNDLTSVFSGSAWELDDQTNQYYLHLYSKKQPDLNWENPKVREEIYEMMNFWLEKGIGGFRMDIIDTIGKIPDKLITTNGPKLHDYIQEMNRATFGQYDVLTVGETWGATPEIAKLYSDPIRQELSMVFQFEHIGLDQLPGKPKWDTKKLDFIELKAVFSKWQTELGNKGWNSLFWNNHDIPRIVSNWGDDSPEYRIVSAKMFATFLHLLKGTPYIFQGEEIGLINTPVTSIEEIDDIETVNFYNERVSENYSNDAIFSSINKKGRDNLRRPMQWDSTENAGFTKGKPWLALNPNYSSINVLQDQQSKNSIFTYYKKLIQLRKENELVVYGEYKELVPEDKQLYAYERSYNGETWLIVLNFYKKETVYKDSQQRTASIVISNYPDSSDNLSDLKLRPFESIVFKLNERYQK
ncbi:glucan 1,6-alpha-glucosidase [Carnobacterium iners]|uniref:Glucan 1,6-alpha-glucosidase n=1 Tax=Carnobacterium iners TaxID=1073423 RepID=A0A1X7NC24_9LACT|nr:alpha-glucosidase [Carnobacterium iners]SEL11457.1 glucan 1,6-alpha-glucosidase [Carnobacterium iners]SMH35138.1 glucan 1,6-alpha-glucosidase [Carnobacterium iners]